MRRRNGGNEKDKSIRTMERGKLRERKKEKETLGSVERETSRLVSKRAST